MNSLVKVFSNFKEFYSEINGATLTGAIDVVVVEQPDQSFVCSPFHVRFGKLGVLRSREKIVDIEVNGEPVNIHMKLGESGEAFFVEGCPEGDIDLLPANLATSPIPPEFAAYDEANEFPELVNVEVEPEVVKARRNTIVAIHEDEREDNHKYDRKQRRYTDNLLHRRNLSTPRNELTTQQIRQEWADHEQENFQSGSQTSVNWMSATDNQSFDTPAPTSVVDVPGSDATKQNQNEITHKSDGTKDNALPLGCDKRCDEKKSNLPKSASAASSVATIESIEVKEESKSKKKRRKKAVLKKKEKPVHATLHSTSGITANLIPEVGNETDANLSYTTTSKITDTTNSSDGSFLKEEKGSRVVSIEKTAQFTPNQIADFHFFSDTEVGMSPRESRPTTPIKSDSEFEMSQVWNNSDNDINSASWKWGELPTPAHCRDGNGNEEDKEARRHSMISTVFDFMRQSKKMRNKSQEGIYLSELEAEGLDPEVEALYFPPMSSRNQISLEDRESGNGTSLPQSPSSIDSTAQAQISMDSDFEEGKLDDGKLCEKNEIALSLCGGLEHNGPSELVFNRHLIQYSDVCKDPKIFSSPDLVVRINGKYYNWETACPIVLTALAYQKPLSTDAIDKLSKSTKTTPTSEQPPSSIGSKTNTTDGTNNNRGYSWWYWRKSGGKRADDIDGNKKEKISAAMDGHGQQSEQQRQPPPPLLPSNQSNESTDIFMDDDKNVIKENCEKYRKSLRLTSEQIESLNLKQGINEVVFSVTTAYQGTTRCKCYLFRWKHNDKVVISDIDGTITKSDVLGHILPMVGKDWAQLGVAQLFTKIEENGYKLLYLSARAIGQSRATREYLQSICQGDVKLPDGPLLLNPTSLISAFHREVIERKPEQFKIACLSDIKALFPQNPFYAGYGNRINDVWAYSAVGIPIMRIFTINPKGELKHELTQTFQSTYCSMTYIVDQLFPPVNGTDGSIEFSNVNYWRDPLPELGDDLLKCVGNNNDIETPATTVANQ